MMPSIKRVVGTKKKTAWFRKLWYFIIIKCLLLVLCQHQTKRFLLADKFKRWAQRRRDSNFVFTPLNAKEFVFALTSIKPNQVRSAVTFTLWGCWCYVTCWHTEMLPSYFQMSVAAPTFESVCRRHLTDHFEMFTDELFLRAEGANCCPVCFHLVERLEY